jgi:predicted RND superfamily exporter protein
MWVAIARLILRNRGLWLTVVLLAAAFMAWQAQSVRISYKFSRILPIQDTTQLAYERFREVFGDASNSIFVAVSRDDFFTARGFREWENLSLALEEIEGVIGVVTTLRSFDILYDEDSRKFLVAPLLETSPKDEEEILAFQELLQSRPFYKDLLFTDDGKTQLMMVQLNPDMLYNQEIIRIVEDVKRLVANLSAAHQVTYHVSGLPYIRMANVKKVKAEVYLFILLTLIVTALILLVFLKSVRATLISLVVVVIGVIFSFGLISVFDFEITLLSSLIPPLVIVIGIPNCIFLINKYHHEYKGHGNKVKALQRVIRKIGNVTLLTNLTTSLGFAAFILTNSPSLVEFGVVTSLNILCVFVISLTVIPIAYSYLKPPKKRHYRHLDQKWLQSLIDFLIRTVQYHRVPLYLITSGLIILGFIGMLRIYTTGNLSDDFSKQDAIYKDLKFIESQFKGVVPLEIVIDSKREKGMMSARALRDMERFQNGLDTIENISRSLGLTDFVKFLRQGFFQGNPDFYDLPSARERSWILNALPDRQEVGSYLNALSDSLGQMSRISLQVPDRSAPEMQIVQDQIIALADAVFDSEHYDVIITGAAVVFLKGTYYLIRNLILSLLLAVGVISIIMAFLFGSARMVLISVLPNLIPLLLTAGLMGYLGIPLKPSTILVFSIAFGISVDDTIHFLAKYRQALKTNGWKIGAAVVESIRETGISMFYTSVVLLCGFSMFIASDFGGTVALGVLVSITLFFAMATNLLVLPSLLLSLEKLITSKSFSETIIDGMEQDEEERF